MPHPIIWSAETDQAIRTMRAAGATWVIIGEALGLSRTTVLERGRRLNAVAPEKGVPARAAVVISDDPNRLPLPAWHPVMRALLDPRGLLGNL